MAPSNLKARNASTLAHEESAPISIPQASQKLGNFDLIQRVKLGYTDVTVSKWRSRVTGLTVTHLDYEAPIVNGYFVIPTEIFDDSGCPHTLEHLVFMGSEKYPYKGILDLFANRGFSNGTNAWTDTDHTAYTVSTAGDQGFLQLLPIYIDHILYPTITNSGFVTEVHHIDGKGQDSGVVYSEMQGRQNTSGDLMALKLQRLIDPPGSAYRSETGGLMEALRVLTPEQIRKYHSTYYVPHNLTLIVGGKLSKGTESLLQVVQDKVEPNLIQHGQNKGARPEGWQRPFVETPSATRTIREETTKETVEFPEKDESMGELVISYVGPKLTDFLERKALDLLATYLTSSPVAPLNKEFVEIESPLCSYIYFSEDCRATRNDLPIYIGSVPTEHLDAFHDKFKASLEKIANEGLDMDRMQILINRDERQLRSRLESAKGDTFSSTIIDDVLYGAVDGSELKSSMDDISQYQELRKWQSSQWTDLLRKYYIDAPAVVVCGKPSASLADKLEKDEAQRIAEQVKALGPDGLKKAEETLEAAKAENSLPIPDGIISQFPVPSVDSISWIPVDTVQEPGQGRERAPYVTHSPGLAMHIDTDGRPLSFFVEYDHVESDFVTVHAISSLAKLPDYLRPLIPTYLTAFFSLPIVTESGERLSHEAVVNRLENETVSHEANCGFNGAFGELFRISIKVETALYDTAVAWLKDLLFGAQFDKDRLAIAIAKVQQSLPENKRDGSTVLNSLWSEVVYSEASTSRSGAVLAQIDYVPQLAKRLQESPEEVIKEFEEVRKRLISPSGLRFAVSGNVQGLKKPRSTWAKHFGFFPSVNLSQVPLASDTLNDLGRNPEKKAVVMSLPTIESSFAMHTTKGLQGFTDPEYPALRIACEVLNATESYLWRYIRGSGLAYGAYVSMDVESGFVTFALHRSSNSIGAYAEAKKVVNGLVDGTVELDTMTLDAAKSTIVYGVAKGVSTAGRAASTSFVNQALKGVSQRHQVELLEKYAAITKEEVLDAIKKHILPIFDPSSSIAVIVTAPGKADEISKSLEAEGFEVNQRELKVDPSELEESGLSSEDGSDSEDSDVERR